MAASSQTNSTLQEIRWSHSPRLTACRRLRDQVFWLLRYETCAWWGWCQIRLICVCWSDQLCGCPRRFGESQRLFAWYGRYIIIFIYIYKEIHKRCIYSRAEQNGKGSDLFSDQLALKQWGNVLGLKPPSKNTPLSSNIDERVLVALLSRKDAQGECFDTDRLPILTRVMNN